MSGDTVYLIWRIDFDSMENREPVTRAIVGFVTDVDDAGPAGKAMFEATPHYEGFEGGWGGQPVTYPRFEVSAVTRIPHRTTPGKP